MVQYGFFFDQSRCTGCRACTVACKNWNDLPPGPLKFLRVYEYERGSFPDVRVHIQWVPCYHCERPACVESCPEQAILKESKYGAVLIDSEKCSGCRVCYEACPYGSIAFASDNAGEKARKCTMCINRLEQGLKPICVSACHTRALDFGPLENLVKRYGDLRDLEDLPSSKTTKPAAVFRPSRAKRRLVPYDAERALDLMKRRDPLPPVFNSKREITDLPEGTVGRDRLVVKHRSVEELMRRTRDDES